MLMSWAAYSSTSSLSRSVHSWLAESSGTNTMSLFSFICFYLRPFRSPRHHCLFGETVFKSPAWIVPFQENVHIVVKRFFSGEESESDSGRGIVDRILGFVIPLSLLEYEKSSLSEAFKWSGQRDSNPRSQPWQGCALPTKLCPQMFSTVVGNE